MLLGYYFAEVLMYVVDYLIKLCRKHLIGQIAETSKALKLHKGGLYFM